MLKGWGNTLKLLPAAMADTLRVYGDGAEEIRLRRGRRPGVVFAEGELSFGSHNVTDGDIAHVLDRASGSSLHAVASELRQGFILAPGGVRVGVCGTAVIGDRLEGLRDISSLALRIPREIPVAGAELLPRLEPYTDSVLIISPPGGGKTTLLRRLIRCSSDLGRRVAVCDSRREIWGGGFFDLGEHTDILSGAPKAEGTLILLRSMNPQVIALDEISDPAESAALSVCANCGAAVFATVHGGSAEELMRRPVFAELMETKIFSKAVEISMSGGRREYRLRELC